MRAGDENRTRTLSLGSDGAWASCMALTSTDAGFLAARGGRIAPLLTVGFRPYGHGVGTEPRKGEAGAADGACCAWAIRAGRSAVEAALRLCTCGLGQERRGQARSENEVRPGVE
jgi:hypothetical protein